MKKWSGGQKKIFVFIECSDQDLRISDFGQLKGADGQPIGTKMRGPTADEMKAEIDIAMKHGAAGIIYFPQVIGKGWGGFDGTTPAVEAAMKEANAKLKADAEKAAKPKAGIGDPATPTAKPRASLEGTDITIDGVTYTLVLKE